MRSARARFEAAEQRPTSAAQIIARHSVALELRELAELEVRLKQIETVVAAAILSQTDIRDFRRLRLAD